MATVPFLQLEKNAFCKVTHPSDHLPNNQQCLAQDWLHIFPSLLKLLLVFHLGLSL